MKLFFKYIVIIIKLKLKLWCLLMWELGREEKIYQSIFSHRFGFSGEVFMKKKLHVTFFSLLYKFFLNFSSTFWTYLEVNKIEYLMTLM